jgi:hypothetical protein
MRRWALMLAAAATVTQAAAQPIPPRRPPIQELVPTPQQAAPSVPAEVADQPKPEVPHSDVGQCLAKLREGGWEADAAKATADNAACTVDEPVILKRLRFISNRSVAFPDTPVVACRFAERVGRWVSDLVVPMIAGRLGTELKAFRTGPGFECRNRNRSAAGKLSAHAVGLAIDVAGFDLVNGERLLVTELENGSKAAVLRGLRTGYCGWYTTILGPGTDAAHASHWHLDI